MSGTYLRILWERRNSALLQKQEFKEKRYKCVMILMYVYLDFNKNKKLIQRHPERKDIETPQDLKDELIMELYNMFLFASGEVLTSMRKVIEQQTKPNFLEVALAMRKDLWGGRVSVKQLKKLSV